MKRCSICHTLIQTGEMVRACHDCQQEYHQECWDENGGCATYGCESAAAVEKVEVPLARGAGWGDEKSCPNCSATIASSVLRCPSCQAEFPYADPMSEGEYDAHVQRQSAKRGARTRYVLLFLASLTGVLAPVAALAAALLTWRERRLLVGHDGAFLALGYGTMVIGVAYTLMFTLLSLGG